VQHDATLPGDGPSCWPGFFGISILWPLFNSLIPPMLE
jgi:hypothetical protein